MAKMKAAQSILSRLAYDQGDEEAADDVHIFAVSASDGMMDILNPKKLPDSWFLVHVRTVASTY